MRSIRKLFAFALLAAAHAHSSCCTKHLQYIPDPEEMPPDEFEGQPRLIPDPADMKPAGWDDDDDGPWQPRDKVNPAFAWRARLVPNPEYQPPGFFKAVQTELLKAAPWVLIGLGVTVALEALQIPLEGLSGLLKHAGPFTGAIVGLATPLCSCGMLPVAAGFVGAGVPLDVVVSFLTASQSAGLDSAAITWGLLGRDAALCRLGGAVALATAAGLAASGAAAAAQAAAPAKSAPAKAAEGAAAGGLLVRLWRAALNSAADVFPSLFMGLFLSAALGQLLPSLRTAYVALRPAAAAGPAGELATRLAVLVSALPLQLCEHSTVTYAALIQRAGGAPGLAFAFLLSAPATNLPSLLLLLRAGAASKSWVAVRVAAALTLTALALSYAVDALGVDLLVERQDKEADAAAAMELPEGLVLASPWVLGALAAAALARSVSRRLHKVSPSPAADKVADCCAASTCGGATPEDKAAKEAKLGIGTEELVSRQERIDALKTMRDLVNEKASETGMSKEEAFQALRAEMERDADYVHVPRPDAAEGKF